MSKQTQTHTLTRSYPATPESVPLARRTLVEFAQAAGIGEEQVDAVRLAASEAITNVVRHAYSGGPGMVHVTAAIASDELWLLIGDDGRGLEAGSDRPGLGMGLALIASISDYFAVVKRSCGGTELRMRFQIDANRGPRPSRLRPPQSRGSVASARSAA